MWKYVTRRIRDTFEKGANHFDKRHSAVLNTKNNLQEEKNKNANSPCCWFMSRKCWNSYQNGNDTNNKQWNFEQLNRTWIGAITWSSALVFGWYTSQLIHLKCKKESKINNKYCLPKISYLFQILPCLNNDSFHPLQLPPQLETSFPNVPPTLHFVTNDNLETSQSSGSTANSDDLGEVLNSIENRLGLAAIENGQHQDGLNLLRSAANRNHPPALYNLGLCYELGMGVETDEKIAMELYRSAAALQHPGALYNLGIYYGQGRGGLTRDKATAIRLLRLAAVQGQQDAITALKSLEEPSMTPPETEMDAWTKQFTPFTNHANIVPTHSALFVDNNNTLNAQNYNYEPVVF
ncbi:jg27776 [Pararge aegeria aegeria]|uniref:Jg27776 protein n=1 Tax=Pararge aegeria aegeria TaxID=348720 RepID=A0A8S4SBG3_9NEOP|nr:jg27776 [Pararge aegeria aegeria]